MIKNKYLFGRNLSCGVNKVFIHSTYDSECWSNLIGKRYISLCSKEPITDKRPALNASLFIRRLALYSR